MNGDTTKSCCDCRFGTIHPPSVCRLHKDAETGLARLTAPLRAARGVCGPEAAFFEPREATFGQVVPFPVAHRVSA